MAGDLSADDANLHVVDGTSILGFAEADLLTDGQRRRPPLILE